MPACLPKATALLVLLTRETERHINLSVGSLHDAMACVVLGRHSNDGLSSVLLFLLSWSKHTLVVRQSRRSNHAAEHPAKDPCPCARQLGLQQPLGELVRPSGSLEARSELESPCLSP